MELQLRLQKPVLPKKSTPIIDEFIDKADYFSAIEGYVYDKTITVPNMAAVMT